MSACIQDGCAGQNTARGLCAKHYRRAQRGGRLAEYAAVRTPRGLLVCAVDDCDQTQYARDYCLKHYYRFLRHGDALSVASGQGINHTQSPSYGAAHWRVVSAKGRAALRICVDCGQPASEWSYNHADPDELREARPNGSIVAYSTDIENYEPRCIPCHRQFDATSTLAPKEAHA